MKYIKILFLVSVIFLSFCSGNGGESVKAPGIVEGDVISLKSRVSAKVDELFFDEGDRVGKGDTVAKLDSRILENQMRDIVLKLKELDLNLLKMKNRKFQVEANIDYLKKQTESMSRLSRKKSVSGDSYEKIKLKLLEARTSHFDIVKSIEGLNLQRAILDNKRRYLELLLEDYTISSTVAGYILERFVSVGENVFPGMAIADILDTGSMYVEIFLEEKELSGITIGQKVRIVVDGLEDNDLRGVISFIGKKAEFSPKYVISEKERRALLFKVKVSLKDNKDVYKIGMPVTVIVELKKV